MKRIIIYIAIAVTLISLWEYLGASNSYVRLLISSPSHVIEYFSYKYLDLFNATKITFIEALIGLLIAAFFSFMMMMICFFVPRFMDFIMPIMITSQVIPLIVLAPFLIILLGPGVESKIIMAALLSFFPIFVNFAQGFKAIDKTKHELLSVYNSPKMFAIRRVYIPLSLPNIFAGLKVSATLSVIGAIVAEFSGAEAGLGKNLFISAMRLDPELMVSSLILSSFVGLFLYGTILKLERSLVKW